MLWPCDDPRALCDALWSVEARASAEMRAAVRAHFERELSFEALGLKLAAMYEEVHERKYGAAPTRWSDVNANGAIRTS